MNSFILPCEITETIVCLNEFIFEYYSYQGMVLESKLHH